MLKNKAFKPYPKYNYVLLKDMYQIKMVNYTNLFAVFLLDSIC